MRFGQRILIRILRRCRVFPGLMVLLASGCSLSPSIPILGAAFPSWLFCLFGAVALLVVCHIVITRKQWQEHFSPLVVSYSGLLFLFAALLWFLFFVN